VSRLSQNTSFIPLAELALCSEEVVFSVKNYIALDGMNSGDLSVRSLLIISPFLSADPSLVKSFWLGYLLCRLEGINSGC
jgi:hypothetical protein